MGNDTALQPAKLTDRFLAYLIDLAPLVAGYYASLYVAIVRFQWHPNTSYVWKKWAGVWVGLYLLYQALGNRAGATLGKRLFGLRVVDLQGEPLDALHSVMRALGYLLSTPFFSLGFLWSLGHPQSRTWHDLLAGSKVIESREKSPTVSLIIAAMALLVLAALVAIASRQFSNSAR